MPGFVSAQAAAVRKEREEARARAEQPSPQGALASKPVPRIRRSSESPSTNRKPLGNLPTVHGASGGTAGGGATDSNIGAKKPTTVGTGVGSTPTTAHLHQQVSNVAGNGSSSPLLPCIGCQNRISPSARFCSSCGTKQERSEPVAPTPQPLPPARSNNSPSVQILEPPSAPPPGPSQQFQRQSSGPQGDDKPPPAGGLRNGRSTSVTKTVLPATTSAAAPAPNPVKRPRSRGRTSQDGSATTPPPPVTTTASRPPAVKSAGSKPSGAGVNAAADNFPKMPLASEMTTKRDVFMGKIDSFAGKQFSPEDFESGKTGKLSEVEEPGTLFADADTRVFVRCRPILSHETDKTPVVTKASGCKDTILLAPQVSLSGGCTLSPYPLPVDATFASNDTNDEVYSYLSELVHLALRGGSSSILCYGQTGSGKTYTTTGLLTSMAAQIEEAIVAGKVEITATFVELHHEGCRDLISCEPSVNICEVGNKVELQKSQPNPVSSAQHFLQLVQTAVGNRSTKATLKNAGSSRSHMVIRILVTDVETPWANPGVLCIADLAGSESNADSKEHDKERVIETKFINSSLMTLKDCIRARGVAATSTKHVHIPYRQTSLTTIMKDSFELVVKRPTKAAVIACVSPLFMDIRHTGNTVRYASLLYVSPKKRIVVADNPEDPQCWDRDEVLKRLSGFGGPALTNPELVLPEGDGRALVLVTEADFLKRVMETHPKIGEKKAGMIYTRVWKAVVDSRTKTRKDILKVNPAANRETEVGRVGA